MGETSGPATGRKDRRRTNGTDPSQSNRWAVAATNASGPCREPYYDTVDPFSSFLKQMPELEYFLVAESCSVDAERHSLSIFHVMNDVRLDQLPGNISELVVISAWIHSPDELEHRAESQIRLQFEIPGMDGIHEFRGNLNAETRFQNFNFNFREVPAPAAGDFVIKLFLNDKHKATHIVAVSDRGQGYS